MKYRRELTYSLSPDNSLPRLYVARYIRHVWPEYEHHGFTHNCFGLVTSCVMFDEHVTSGNQNFLLSQITIRVGHAPTQPGPMGSMDWTCVQWQRMGRQSQHMCARPKNYQWTGLRVISGPKCWSVWPNTDKYMPEYLSLKMLFSIWISTKTNIVFRAYLVWHIICLKFGWIWTQFRLDFVQL